MPLTRPLINNLNTNVEVFNDTITVLHGNASVANADIGLLMNRAGGLVANVALYWNESSQSFITAYTSSDGVSYSNVSSGSSNQFTVSHTYSTIGKKTFKAKITDGNGNDLSAYCDPAATINVSVNPNVKEK